MKKFIYVLILIPLIFSCGETTKKPVPPKDGAFNTKVGDDSVQFLYKNGLVISETTIVNGKPHGISKDYYNYKEGKLRSTLEYKEARRHGLYVMFYETGEKYSEMPYVEGKKHGTRYVYKKDGSVSAKASYADNNLVPPLEEFDNGKPVEQPKIKFKTVGGMLNMELSDRTFSIMQFYVVLNDKLLDIKTEKGVGSLSIPPRGTVIRATYKTRRGNEGAVDAKY